MPRPLLTLLLLPSLALAGDGASGGGWFLAGAEEDYRAAPVERACDGGPGLRLASKGRATRFVTSMQLFQADAFRGQRLRFSATLRTEDASRGAGLWMRVDGEQVHRPLALDTMQDRRVTGTGDCTPVSVVLDVPPQAVTVAAGVVLEGEGAVELSGVRFEAVPPEEFASTDLLPRKLPVGAPGLAPEEKPNELEASRGRVGTVWFNDTGLHGPLVELRLRNPGRWSDDANDNVVLVSGDRLELKLWRQKGVLSFRREGEALVISGRFGWPDSYPLSVRLDRERLDMSWGMYERHLTREDAAQVDPGCIRFTQRNGTLLAATDLLYVCGVVLEPDAPAVQSTVAFLLNGFKRTPVMSDMQAPARRRFR